MPRRKRGRDRTEPNHGSLPESCGDSKKRRVLEIGRKAYVEPQFAESLVAHSKDDEAERKRKAAIKAKIKDKFIQTVTWGRQMHGNIFVNLFTPLTPRLVFSSTQAELLRDFNKIKTQVKNLGQEGKRFVVEARTSGDRGTGVTIPVTYEVRRGIEARIRMMGSNSDELRRKLQTYTYKPHSLAAGEEALLFDSFFWNMLFNVYYMHDMCKTMQSLVLEFFQLEPAGNRDDYITKQMINNAADGFDKRKKEMEGRERYKPKPKKPVTRSTVRRGRSAAKGPDR